MTHTPDLPTARADARRERRLLSPREAEILAAFADGEQTKHIARRDGVSPRTIEKHVENAKAAMGAKTLAHAIAIFARGEIEVRQS
jgi:DNA-binding NarL/FixJ family response regulator